MRSNRNCIERPFPSLSARCVEVVTDDIRDIRDVHYLYADGATSRIDFFRRNPKPDIPGLSIRDTALLRLIASGEIGLDGALEIENAHARAAAVEAVGGWNEILGDPLASSENGDLYEAEWLETRILKVACPSTSQIYFLHVPKSCKNVASALAFVNRGLAPEISS